MWARCLMEKKVGPENPQYRFPKSVLDFIRHIAPGDVVGEIREDAFEVEMAVFCEALSLPYSS